MTRVLLAGGGTAGHTSPLLATADALAEVEPGVEVLCVGTERGLETRVVPAAGHELALVPPVPLPRRPSADLLRVPGRLRGAVREARAVLERFDPDVVVGYGGYVSLPVYLAARKRAPVVVHEQNALPGLANRVGARLAARVAVSFPGTPLPRAEVVGLPVRRLVSRLDRAAVREEARAHFGLDADRPTLLVTGGSQGARRLNEGVSGAAAALAAAGVQVLHVIGPRNELDPAAPGPAPYVVEHYVDRMDLAYAAADLVVCRAGANSVAEAAAVGLPAVFVPLPIGNGEQARNARPVVDAGGALLVDDAAVTPEWVASTVAPLAADGDRLREMGRAAADILPADADVRLAELVLATARGRRS